MSYRHLLWRFFWYQRWRYLLFASLTLLNAAILLIPAFLARAFFNALTSQAPVVPTIVVLAALVLLVQLARVATSLASGVTNILAGFTSKALVRVNIMRRILIRPGAQALPCSVGNAMDRLLTDGDALDLFLSALITLLGQSVFALVAMVTMLRLNWRITLVLFPPFIAVATAAQLVTVRYRRYRRASRETSGRVAGALTECFEAVQAIKVANAEGPVITHLGTLNEARRRAGLQERLFDATMGSVFAGAVTLGTGVMLLLSGRAMRAGTFTVGDFALFTYFLGSVSEVIRSFGGILAGAKRTGVSFERLAELLQGEPAEALVRPGPVHLTGELPRLAVIRATADDRLERLEVSGLRYHYPGSAHGIDAVNLRLTRGSFTVITGRIGAGKTTLLRVLLGLLPRDAGEIHWNGHVVADAASCFVPPRGAYTPQAPRLFSATLRDNILLGLPAAAVDLDGAVRLAALERDIGELERGLDTRVGPRGVKLSGGQVQRAAAARRVVAAPELLVIDDLSSALDVETERTLWERLFERRECTCLAVSHRRAALQRADQIVVVQDGRVEDHGTLAELLGRCEEMRRLWSGDVEPAVVGAAVTR